jgi:hypothetical protein
MKNAAPAAPAARLRNSLPDPARRESAPAAESNDTYEHLKGQGFPVAGWAAECENEKSFLEVKMRAKAILLAAAMLAIPMIASAGQGPSAAISGDYAEFRNADVYTGPCFANAEMNLTGDNAVLAWHVRDGSWSGVSIAGLSVVAVVRASSTLGDPYTNPLPAKTVFMLDARASDAQRAALVQFAQAQASGLLNDVVALQSVPISFSIAQHGYTTVQAGNVVRLATRTLRSTDELCHNEEVYYPPLAAHLEHSMPVVAQASSYSGNQLGVTWNDSGRRSSFVGSFAE